MFALKRLCSAVYRTSVRMIRLLVIRKPGRYLFFVMVLLCIILTYFSTVLRNSIFNPAQRNVDYIAGYVKVKVDVLGFGSVAINLYNSGYSNIQSDDWRIYFFTINRLEPQILDGGLALSRENGGLHFLYPVKETFKGIKYHETVTVVINNFPSVAKSDHFPNWYVSSSYSGTTPKILQSTAGVNSDFVKPFTTSAQWKRSGGDQYNPYSPEQRYELYSLLNSGPESNIQVKHRIVPTPVSVKSASSNHVQVDDKWTIHSGQQFFSVSRYLSEKLKIPRKLKTEINVPSGGRVIVVLQNEGFATEEYLLEVKLLAKTVTISATSESGAFYGIQSLLSLMNDSNSIPEITIRDKPRFPYRGLMLDVARNFMPKSTVLKVIDNMAQYKLNVLHLHLTDDEGWRIEIPAIPELTQFASRRCHDNTKNRCLQSSLGSGPFSDNSGSGFYSVAEFRDILRYAADRFVKIIPEIDVPGHSKASIVAMRFREEIIQKRSEGGGYSDVSYMLTDTGESGTESVQGWGGNSVNPCLNATYKFIDTVVEGLKLIYDGIQILDVVHLGGDEVPQDAWLVSQSCEKLLQGRPYDDRMLKKMFMVAAADVAFRRDLDIATWEDGMYERDEGPYKRDLFKSDKLYINAWNNIWEQGRGGRAIEFANAGYKSILSMGTHLYFDHPYEPDPEERGLYWATRYTDTFKVFGFMPDDIYSNADYDHNGNPLDKEAICLNNICPALTAPENVLGMEACLWSETVRSEEQLFYMLMPRLIAYAERSWHKADWESIPDKRTRDVAKQKDWELFLNVLSRNELPKLERKGITYHIPPPGVIIDTTTNFIEVNTLYPGFTVQFSSDKKTWLPIPSDISLPKGQPRGSFRTVSPSRQLYSRVIDIEVLTNDLVHGIHNVNAGVCQFQIDLLFLFVTFVYSLYCVN